MKIGDVVRNNHQSEGNLYRYQIIERVFNGGKSARTIDYMGNTHVFDNAIEHMEVVGHSKEYDAYIGSLKNLINFDKQINRSSDDANMEVYYEDYRLKVVKKESGKYDIHDSKYGGKITHKDVSKEKADERIQEILSVRNRRQNRNKKEIAHDTNE